MWLVLLFSPALTLPSLRGIVVDHTMVVDSSEVNENRSDRILQVVKALLRFTLLVLVVQFHDPKVRAVLERQDYQEHMQPHS